MMPIYLYHDQRYMTEYIDPVLEDTKHFAIVRGDRNSSNTYKGHHLEAFNSNKHHTILCAGYIYEETRNNLILCRYLHSPGFCPNAFIEGYFRMIANHFESDFRYILLEEHYKMLLTIDSLPENHALILDKLMQDDRVSLTKVDTMLYQIRDIPKKHNRILGTGLIALSWLIVNEEPQKLQDIINTLSPHLKLTIVFHPLTLMMGKEEYLKKIKGLTGIDRILMDIPRSEMVDLYDEHEFIITDGSGSCYEALLRGCKPLLISDLIYQQEKHLFRTPIESGYLPFQDYREINKYKSFNTDVFLKKIYPFLYKYTFDEAKKIMIEEILSLVH